MEFHNGLNVIIGANNSGKTGLLSAIYLLSEPTIVADDFNKNDLLNFSFKYRDDAPQISVEYTICHKISEDNTKDESILRLLPFLGIKEFKETRPDTGEVTIYDITAVVRAVCTLDEKALSDYKAEVAKIEGADFSSYFTVLKSFEQRYSWDFYNATNDTEADKKDATGIFDIRFIGAERTSDDVHKETKREIDTFAKDQSSATKLAQLRDSVAGNMKEILHPALEKLSQLFEQENNDIGLSRGNVSIAQNLHPNVSVGDSYVTEVRDTKADYIIPLRYNGLGYNNLINIYMLIKLTEIQPGRDFRILLLEEPEAHLHPALQYKLFKYLCQLDSEGSLNQQIFVTTHSSNIAAVAGIDNMFMLAYERGENGADCAQQSLFTHFTDNQYTKTQKTDAKKHLTKFLDVTRSDMLFADRVILVEGIGERLLMPLFMEKCGCSYEDEHVSVVEIGGKHFEHFVEMFNGNAVRKKVLCITDRDFVWISDGKAKTFSDYESFTPQHITKLKERFSVDNLFICTQLEGGRTFEDELFLSNLTDTAIAAELFQIVASESVYNFAVKYGFNIEKWDCQCSEIDGRSLPVVERLLNAFKQVMASDIDRKDDYARLFFAELFLNYAKGRKGDTALEILVKEKIIGEKLINELANKLIVPRYIQEGLKWLLK